jgi:hypothetical protein
MPADRPYRPRSTLRRFVAAHGICSRLSVPFQTYIVHAAGFVIPPSTWHGRMTRLPIFGSLALGGPRSVVAIVCRPSRIELPGDATVRNRIGGRGATVIGHDACDPCTRSEDRFRKIAHARFGITHARFVRSIELINGWRTGNNSDDNPVRRVSIAGAPHTAAVTKKSRRWSFD